MKKLPTSFLQKIKFLVLPLFIAVFIFLLLSGFNTTAHAVEAPTATPVPPAATATPVPGSTAPSVSADGKWVDDPEVTFVGKTARRSEQFLDWALRNYSWLCVTKISQNQCDNRDNPLIPFWQIIRNIVYALIALFVLATAFILIVTRGQNITIMRFVPRFMLVLVLITLSFSLVQFVYQATDLVQDFFLKNADRSYISTQNLLYIGFDYESFKGYRISGAQHEESAFISLLLVRLTAITYYVMTGILIVRKVILWFFIIISPIFPLLLFYKPLRNTAKIWIGEFFRWLLYAPLFAIFLNGLVVVWKSSKGIPLAFNYDKVGEVVYPTAINILLGGPGQTIFYNSPTDSNSVNLSDTFALYVVALLMLWVVILLPFLLLKIFLDYVTNLSFDNNMALKQVVSRGAGLFSPQKGIPPAPSPTPPGSVGPTGAARSMPFMHKQAVSISQPLSIKADVQASVRESSDVLRLTNLSIPKMRDIARFETSMMSSDVTRRNEATQLHSTLSKIANPSIIATPAERDKFTTVRQQLLQQKQKGNPIASSVLSASQVSATAKAQTIVKTRQDQMTHATQALQSQTKNVTQTQLPNVNKVQQVSLDDYEEVRKLWTENYQTIEPPKSISGVQMERQEWIKNDTDRITQAISLLNSEDPAKVNQGMEMVANILPFLLIGGFSKSEVIAYLKAKMQAGKSVLEGAKKKEEDEESMVGTTKKEEQAEGHMSAAASLDQPLDEPKSPLEQVKKEDKDLGPKDTGGEGPKNNGL